MSTPISHPDDTVPVKKKLGPTAIAIIVISAMALMAVVIFIVQTFLDTIAEPLQDSRSEPTTTITEQVDPDTGATLEPAPLPAS